MKKLLLIIALLISVLGLNAQSVTIDYGDYSLTFSVTNQDKYYCEVAGCTGPTTKTAITIPSTKVTINGRMYSVTSIGHRAFEECSNLTSIEIPSGVTSIGSQAFSGCSSLTSIKIPNSVTSIEGYAFEECSSLTSIEIPNSVTSIGGGAFSGCRSLTSIEIPNSVTSIGSLAFEGCSKLTSIEIPNSVTSIDYKTFKGCSSLTSIVIPNSVTYIGSLAFEGCSKLTSIEFPSGVTSIGYEAFKGCSSLTSILFHAENVVEVEDKELGDDCSRKMIIYVPKNLVKAYRGESSEWRSYTIRVIDAYQYTTIMDFEGYTLEFPATSSAPAECEVVCGIQPTTKTAITIPSKVTIKGKEFCVTSIGYRAFEECSNLTSIEIPNSVTSIEEYAFYGCSSLTSIEIPNGVTSIGENTFYGCSSLTSIEIPNSVTSIEEFAFYGCSSLTSIEIPNGVTSIGIYTFYGCSSLTSIGIPNSVTSIGCDAFSYCSSLTSIELPSGVTSIEVYAFSYCSSLTSIELPSGVTSIGNGAFSGCSSLTSIELPNSVTSIGDAAFHCESLGKIICYAEQVPKTHKNAFNRKMVVYVPNSSIEIYKVTLPWSDCTILPITNKVKTSINVKNTGSVTGAGDYYYGEEVVLTATANEGYKFVNWTENGVVVSEDAEYSFVILKDRNLVANFSSEDIPLNVVAIVIDNNTIKVEWDAVASAESYNVYRTSSTRSYEFVANVKTTSYTDTGLDANTQYSYSVTSVSSDGRESEKSESAGATTKPESIEEFGLALNIYPNPVNDKLYIEAKVEIKDIVVYDIYGRQQILSAVSNQQSAVSVAHLNSGVYFVKVVTNDGEVVKRFVKK